MITGLRKKVFWSIECSALAVLILILTVYDCVYYIRSEQEEWQMLYAVAENAADRGDSPAAAPDRRKLGKNNKRAVRVVNNLMAGEIGLIEFDEDGSMGKMSGFLESAAQEDAEKLFRSIVSQGDSRGHVRGYKYIVSGAGVIAVLNAGYVNRDFLLLLLFSMLGLVLAGLVFGLIAAGLSRSIVQPVDEAMRKQEQFIADASHELKTPVAVMLANIAVLEKETGSSRWMEYIKEEGRRISNLTNDLLTLSRLDHESGRTIERAPFDFSSAVLEAALPFESIAFEQGVEYRLNVPESMTVVGNADELKQIAGILIDNALKNVGRQGSVEVSLSGTELFERRRVFPAVVLSVQNTGETIPPEVLPRLFDRFYKTDSSRQYSEGGFGLGLAIAKSLTERNKGVINVVSQEGVTTFSVTLPAGAD